MVRNSLVLLTRRPSRSDGHQAAGGARAGTVSRATPPSSIWSRRLSLPGSDTLEDRRDQPVAGRCRSADYSETIYPYISSAGATAINRRGKIHHPFAETEPKTRDGPREKQDVPMEHGARGAFSTVSEFPRIHGQSTISEGDAAKLAALGYVGAVRASPDSQSLRIRRTSTGINESRYQASHE